MRSLILALLLVAVPAAAAPAYLNVETGLTSFKWNETVGADGIPLFSHPRWDFLAEIQWAPGPIERAGFFLAAGFKYQALGWSRFAPEVFVDGPRLSIVYRGRLGQ